MSKKTKIKNKDKYDFDKFLGNLRVYGTPYIVKLFILFGIALMIFIFSKDFFTKSINITTFIATVTIDMWLVENHSDFAKYIKFRNWQFGYFIFLILVLVLSIILTIYCANHQIPKDLNWKTRVLSVGMDILLVPIGIFSPVFEMMFSFPIND